MRGPDTSDTHTDSLEEIELDLSSVELPDEVEEWLAFVDRKSDEWYAEGLGERFPRHTMSDPLVVAKAIAFLQEHGLVAGNLFCEWGAGLGSAAGVAALLGLSVIGIEQEEVLVNKAKELTDEFGIAATFLACSFLPEGFEETEGIGGRDLVIPRFTGWSESVAVPAEIGGFDMAEVALFFVYPWPDQEEMILDLFVAVAEPDSILLIYQGDGEISAFLKT